MSVHPFVYSYPLAITKGENMFIRKMGIKERIK